MGIIGMLDASLDVVLNIKVWTADNVSLFLNVAYWMNVLKAIQPLIGDDILVRNRVQLAFSSDSYNAPQIYRCWIVWERRWTAIIVPVVSWFAGLGASLELIARSATTNNVDGINAQSLTPFIGAAYTLTVALNIIATSLIVYRICTVSCDVRQYIAGHDRLHYVIRIIIESGALYSATAVLTLFTTISKCNADYIMANVLVQMTGICFNLIIIRFD
ncbi:hypothetical protein CERSUDRAFT_95817 [Gelatoporia subvermispora B]|uniref:Uncharacterized protein n=1 Tax=Ceriporiopsis subvermispora (strain B) TaxID=914234 RepID=M2RDK9_CERS8|nr:hypothetical protein CERSUDRAFT_95817 [Gelatoporia subvermispora B]